MADLDVDLRLIRQKFGRELERFLNKLGDQLEVTVVVVEDLELEQTTVNALAVVRQEVQRQFIELTNQQARVYNRRIEDLQRQIDELKQTVRW